MIEHYPVVVERESNGTFSAWVAGLPGVYAAADTAAVAKRAIRSAVAAHLDTLTAQGRHQKPQVDLVVLRYDVGASTRRDRLRFIEPDALLGEKTTTAKIEAAKRNDRNGGRPAGRAKPGATAGP